ncbi:deoxyribonuclease-1-like 1 isoform X1 [Lepisosteus oculatus]|uniref:deoxyribonuclease-1-like 1 isoform X1 n=2 Tax=Lepisosteus oculatus TaxID=7918 RepID=UPI0035F52CB5
MYDVPLIMKSARFLLCFLLLEAASTFKICSFNVQSFGESKSSNEKVMLSLVKIVSRCDVCLLQEVRDSKGRAVPKLIRDLNRYDEKHKYEFVASGRLGRTEAYQEQYVFVYRSDQVEVKDKYQYPDRQKGDVDAFAREPFVVHFRAPKTVARDIVLIPQHTAPANATKEIDELYDVFQEVKRLWKIKNVMFLGDFNAACGYVPKKDWKNIRLFTQPGFFWLIDNKADTTVRATTDCAYDRIVVHGDSFFQGIVPHSAKPFNFAREFHLREDEALEVSDHYPVEVEIKTTSSGYKENQVHHVLVLIAVFAQCYIMS